MVASLAWPCREEGRDACVFLIVSLETLSALSAKILDILGPVGAKREHNPRQQRGTLLKHIADTLLDRSRNVRAAQSYLFVELGLKEICHNIVSLIQHRQPRPVTGADAMTQQGEI